MCFTLSEVVKASMDLATVYASIEVSTSTTSITDAILELIPGQGRRNYTVFISILYGYSSAPLAWLCCRGVAKNYKNNLRKQCEVGRLSCALTTREREQVTNKIAPLET